MNFNEVIPYLFQENYQMAKQAKKYETLSRVTLTNQALINQVDRHEQLLSKSNPDGTLFVVGGAYHLDPAKNQALQKKIDHGDEITIYETHSTPW